jgi:hypothetical protein
MKTIRDKKDNWGIILHDKFKIESIKNEVESYYVEWLSDTSRQKQYVTHENTFMYQLCELDYMWSMKDTASCNTTNYFKTDDARKELKDIYDYLEKEFNGRVIRCEVINMNPDSRVRDHKDRSDVLYLSRRFHIPIKTNNLCFFTVNNETVNMLEGNLYEINNTKWHNVKNLSYDNRIHLIVDIMPIEHTEKIRFSNETE